MKNKTKSGVSKLRERFFKIKSEIRPSEELKEAIKQKPKIKRPWKKLND